MAGAPGGDNREDANCGGGLSAAEAERGPDQKGEAQIFEWIIFHDGVKTVAKDEPSGGEESKEKKDEFENLFAGPLKIGIFDPQQDKRRNDKRADAVAQPPSNPDREIVRPGCQTAQD